MKPPERAVVNAIEWLRRRPWPTAAQENGRVGVVIVNYNTPRLLAETLFCLFRCVEQGDVHRVVVVDNSTNDESVELLRDMAGAEMIEVLRNRRLRYHGPGLNRGIAHIRKTADVEYIWVLDSDCMPLRADVLADAISFMRTHDAPLIGSFYRSTALPCSLMFDPARVWRASVPPFFEDGSPAIHMQARLRHKHDPPAEFPFIEDNYVLHIGTGTLQEIVRSGDESNRFHGWAVTTYEHYQGNPDGPALYARIVAGFNEEVGNLTPSDLLGACRRERRLDFLH